jgi:hypothetical protein
LACGSSQEKKKQESKNELEESKKVTIQEDSKLPAARVVCNLAKIDVEKDGG